MFIKHRFENLGPIRTDGSLDLTVRTSLAQDRSKETLQKREDEEREAKEKKTEAQNEKKGLTICQN